MTLTVGNVGIGNVGVGDVGTCDGNNGIDRIGDVAIDASGFTCRDYCYCGKIRHLNLMNCCLYCIRHLPYDCSMRGIYCCLSWSRYCFQLPYDCVDGMAYHFENSCPTLFEFCMTCTSGIRNCFKIFCDVNSCYICCLIGGKGSSKNRCHISETQTV